MPETDTVSADAYLGEDGAFQEGWLESLPEDTFEKDDTGNFKQGDLADHKSVASVVKSYLNKDKLLGTAIQPLAEDATPDQKKAYKAKVGCPETVEGYEIAKPTLPEGMVYDDDLIKAASQYAHDKHMPKGVFEGLAKIVFDGQIKKTTELLKAAQEAATVEADKKAKADTAAYEKAETTLRGKWTVDYDANLEMANRGYNMPGNDEVNNAFVELIENSTAPDGTKGLKSHPAVVEFMYHFYKDYIKPAEVPGGGAGPGEGGPPGQLDYSTVVGNSGK